MSKEWYLMHPPHEILSGFEEEALADFGQDGLEETLESDIADDVVLYNYDLSESKPIKAIIGNKTQDTKLKTLTRHMMVPIGTCKAGMYVYYKDRYWIIVGIVDDNKVYEKAILSICNYKLSWLNEAGKPVSRWANITSASQYNNGETPNNNFTVRSDQLLVVIPDDDESVTINTNKVRFIVDRRCKVYERRFPEGTVKDTSNPVLVYRVTRSDSALYDYGDSGHAEYMIYETEQHYDDGYYVIDGQGYWLCSEPEENSDASALTCEIQSESDEVFIGLEPTEFIGVFYDDTGKQITATAEWTIDFDYELDVDYVDNSILISTNNDKLANKSFTLTLTADGYTPVSKQIFIREFF